MSDIKRSFPDAFMWGTATASFQIEGGASDRLPSIWDTFCDTPGKVHNGDTGKIACDHYAKFREDVSLIKSLNTPFYRFSISWPRLMNFENGVCTGINPTGLRFYNQLIDALLENGITPVPTLYHWDLPQQIQELGGWENRAVVDLFQTYAKACFESFSDRVKWWITLNEPWCSSVLGYEVGEHAPGITDAPGVKVYIVAHHLLLAHAAAVRTFREHFSQTGQIGITLNSNWWEPKDESCVDAAERSMLFELGWFADPIYFGDYPAIMKSKVGDRLPTFSDEEKAQLKGSSDFFGLNHYSTSYCTGDMPVQSDTPSASYWNDKGALTDNDPAWKKTDMGWPIVPWGFEKLLRYIQARYSPPGGIIVTENGLAVDEQSVEQMQSDQTRVEFYKGYIGALWQAMQGEGAADVRGYFLWSLMDNFEWAFGYGKRFGLFYVDYDTLKRTAKPAVKWYAHLVENNALSAE